MNEEQRTFIHYVNTDSAGKVIVKVTGREGIDLEPHSVNSIQLVEAVAGTLHVMVDGQEYFVPEGYACWIPRRTVHALTSCNRRVVLHFFFFPPEDAAGSNDDEFSVHYVCPWASTNFRFIAEKAPVISKDSDGMYSFCLSFFRMFRREERRVVLPLRGIGANSSPALRKAMDYLSAHSGGSVRMEQAARAAGISQRTLSRLFSETGTTFSDYLNYQRIIRALELMADDTMALKEVAYATGFSTPANFNRAFKQVMGVPPSEMRRRQRA
jgi:AraC-like DNA-binding protein/quercetin dioxygenase-like cupin family protein